MKISKESKEKKNKKGWIFFSYLHVHEIVEGLHFYFNLSVSACVSVGPSMNKMPIERKHQFGRGFQQTVAYIIDSDPVTIGDLESKVKVTVTENLSENDRKKIR